MSPRYSPAGLARSSSWPTRSRASRDFATATTTTCRNRPSTWSAPSRRPSPRPSSSPPRPREMADAFKFELVSPERLLVSGAVAQVLVPGSEGDMTILAHHAPLLSTLRPGLLDITFPSGEQRRNFIRGGFAEVGADGITVLTEQAIAHVALDANKIP